MGWTSKESRFNSWEGKDKFLVSTMSRPVLKPSQTPPSNEYQGLFPRGTVVVVVVWSWPLPPCNAKAKNAWNYVSTYPYIFMVRCLIKYMENFMSIRGKTCCSGVNGTSTQQQDIHSPPSSVIVVKSRLWWGWHLLRWSKQAPRNKDKSGVESGGKWICCSTL
jgi:hypothetical protein